MQTSDYHYEIYNHFVENDLPKCEIVNPETGYDFGHHDVEVGDIIADGSYVSVMKCFMCGRTYTVGI